ncbi:PP2C family protein-serine/threonine phosphatase [Streptomyces sp. NPDC003456]|uniref:PP2C family protein-serine/threonine phosphatase n=1 Tax=Streptomyces sp. NPDC003456 TaxID=3364683 RepID=UPI0036BB1DBB
MTSDGASEPGSPHPPAAGGTPGTGQRPAAAAPLSAPHAGTPGAAPGPGAPVAAPGCGGLPGRTAPPGAPDTAPPTRVQSDTAPPVGAVWGEGRPGGAAVPAGGLRSGRAPGAGGSGHGRGPAERHATRSERFVRLARVRAGGLNIPYGGAEYSGDAWTCVRAGDTVTLMLADGLGHGPEAARASSAAVTALHACADLAPADVLRRLHDALKGTRGAAVSLARLDLAAGRLRFAGIGNVGARLRTGGTWRHLLARPGIVGVHRPTTLREEEADWTGDPLLILHTDGLPSRWAPPPGAGLPAADPAVTAAVTIRDASSPARPVRDDTAVAVLTPTPPELP